MCLVKIHIEMHEKQIFSLVAALNEMNLIIENKYKNLREWTIKRAVVLYIYLFPWSCCNYFGLGVTGGHQSCCHSYILLFYLCLLSFHTPTEQR